MRMKFKLKCEGVVLKTDNCKLAKVVLQFLADERIAEEKQRATIRLPQTWTASYSAKPDLSKLKFVDRLANTNPAEAVTDEELKKLVKKPVAKRPAPKRKTPAKPRGKTIPQFSRPHTKKRAPEAVLPRVAKTTGAESHKLWSFEENAIIIKAILKDKLPIGKIASIPELTQRHSTWGIIARIYAIKRRDKKLGAMAIKQIKDFVKKYGIS